MLNQYYDAERVDQLPGLDPRVQAVMAYLSIHPDYSGEVAALCELFQVSESYLRKLFMDDLGMPPLAYIHQFKVESAQKRLIAGMEKVSEIAYSLGFQDANYFSRLFRKKTGLSPNDYRNKYRNFNIEQ
jgi:AraC-like DNA-binding protein